MPKKIKSYNEEDSTQIFLHLREICVSLCENLRKTSKQAIRNPRLHLKIMMFDII